MSSERKAKETLSKKLIAKKIPRKIESSGAEAVSSKNSFKWFTNKAAVLFELYICAGNFSLEENIKHTKLQSGLRPSHHAPLMLCFNFMHKWRERQNFQKIYFGNFIYYYSELLSDIYLL